MATLSLNSRGPLAMGVVIAVALIAISTSSGVFEPWEMRWLEQVLRWRLKLGLTPPVNSRVVLLVLGVEDEKANAKDDYDDAAAMIEEATACGASAVAFDAVFLRGNEEAATRLREAISAASEGCRVVLGEVLAGKRRRSFPFAAQHRPFGFIDAQETAEGVFRSYRLLYRDGPLLDPSLALAAYLAWLRVEWPGDVLFDKEGEARWTESEGGALSASESPVLLNFRAPWRYSGSTAFRQHTRSEISVMARDAASGGLKPLQGCILLVGQVEDGGDVGVTPLGARQPKILLHATALNDLLQNASLRRLTWWADALLLLATMALPLTVLRGIRSSRIVATIWLAGCLLLLTLSFLLVWKKSTVPGAVLACLGWSAMCGLAGTQRVLPAARRLERLQATHARFDVFISAAHPDYDLAEKVFGFLELSGINAFFCERSLVQVGNSSYSKVIDSALEQATHMIVVATDPAHLRRDWVEAEWRFFRDELRAGRKQGNLVIVTNEAILPEDLPPSLRGYEAILECACSERLLAYLR